MEWLHQMFGQQMWSPPGLNVESYVEPLRSPRSGVVAHSQVVEFHNDTHRNPVWFPTLPSIAQVSWPLGISKSL